MKILFLGEVGPDQTSLMRMNALASLSPTSWQATSRRSTDAACYQRVAPVEVNGVKVTVGAAFIATKPTGHTAVGIGHLVMAPRQRYPRLRIFIGGPVACPSVS